MRAALPVLTRAHRRDDVHPSVALLAGAVLLAMRLVAAGRLEPDRSGWRIADLGPDDQDRLDRLVEARGGTDEPESAALVRSVMDAVADTLPRSAPAAGSLVARRPPVRRTAAPTVPGRTAPARSRAADPAFAERLAERLARHTGPGRGPDDRPHLVTLSLRVEADEGELVGGAVRLVLQVHDERNPLHVADAAVLWAESGADASHGFGDRARTHATIALRSAAGAWPVLDRLLELRVPDEIALDSEELADLLEHGLPALRERGVDVLWPRSLGRDLTAVTVLRPGSGEREEPLVEGLFGPDSMFSFSWQLALHGDPLTEDEMDQLASATGPIVRLRDNWMVVDPVMARRARKRLVRTAKPAQALAATLTGVVTVEDVDEQVVVGATLEKVRQRVVTAATREPVPVPATLAASLRDYQRHGLTWLAELTGLGLGACLADDMGLGKTITLIALHLHRTAHDPDAGPVLVVCPASLLGNWEDEVARFAPGVPVRRFHGTQRDLAGLTRGFVLTTYGTMRRDADLLAGVPWDLVVADEAQHVKNPRASTATALRRIDARARVALTGTPVENNLTELWAILDWAIPGLLGSRNAFRRVWAAPIEAGVDPAKARQFADLISPFLLRRRKSDPGVAPELPAKTETDHRLGLTREQVVLYETVVRESMERIERADEHARRGLVLALLTSLKQICNHPAHYLKQANPRLGGRSEKLELVDELLATVLAEGGAALVFTQYVAMARLLQAHLARTGIPCQLLHGGTPVREREAMVRRFQAARGEQRVPVFLLSLKAGGTGLNLTSADHVVHFDRWWNPAVEDQATDRAYRIGQTRPVQVHRLVTRGTIEEKVAELLTRKRALADAVLGRGEAALTELSDDELRDLVTLRPGATS
ncbi:DEAD/DEAH box helicase [Nocardioides guangzhouensis]|uniref:DEAD/DEAH box helicase n=2 Tax=Nocardioides guangzhouensis TaxID=2497878 RepID=A0A4V1Y026_9ACTN|nr:DEAD/DEAH box helicase [Nocardioides guangzhouensis]